MAHLIHLTKADSSTYGKPRVFISFHADDKDDLVKELCNDILDAHNCALFMYDDGILPEDERQLEVELGPMQLFVLVCTKNYLSASFTEKKKAVDFALDKKIPVLPVILSPRVSSDFNQMCEEMGLESIHCLNKNSFAGDDEAYRAKLKEHLVYFLVDDDSISDIRNSFRACIFLSYRKVDREYALTLIRRIHNLPDYYDVSVWYDDYLIPGRSYEKEIFEAMEQSDLFVLAVTNNITAINARGEENYVVRKEYPEAVRRGKKIIGAELSDPDKSAMMIKFSPVPECFNAYDDLLLGRALSPLDDKPAKSGPLHDYYIGLAYLTGIGVEVDADKAYKLILSAAQSGIEDAMDRLVRMFRMGMAVRKDHSEAIKWQRELVRLARERTDAEDTAENVHSLIYRLSQLGNYQIEVNDITSAKMTFDEVCDLAERYSGRYRLSDLYRDMTVALNKTGDVYLAEKELEKAENAYESSFRAAKILYEECPGKVSARDLAVSCQKIGQIRLLKRDGAEALRYFIQGEEILSELLKEAPTAFNQRDMYIMQTMKGDALLVLGDLDSAERSYLESKELREGVNRELDLDWTHRDISMIWEKLAGLYSVTGRKEEASDAFEEAVSAADDLYSITGLPAHEVELSKICSKAGEFHYDLEDYEEAEFYLRQAMTIDEKYASSEGASSEDLRNLSVSYNRLGGLYKSMDDTETAYEYFHKEYDIAKKIADLFPGRDSIRDLGLSCNYMGGISAQRRQGREALGYYDEGIALLSPVTENSEDPVLEDDLAVLYFNHFRLSHDKQMLRRAHDIWQDLNSRYPQNEEYLSRYELTGRLIANM